MKTTSDGRRCEDHHCHAYHCETRVPPERLMCGKHWWMVPPEIRDRVWKHYRPGQCDDMNPSEEWIKAAQAAREAVLEAERVICQRKHAAGCGCWNGQKAAAPKPVQGDLFQ